MSRMARVEVFAADEIAIVHVMNRTVRRCFLMGEDELTKKNFDHRKIWVEDELKRLAAFFGIDLLCFAILSNHMHLVFRSRPDIVQEWDDTEVARRWLMICPIRKDQNGQAEEPNDFELNTIRNNKVKLIAVRNRLSDISWWMRLLSQTIAQRANKEDGEIGKFWQSRYRAVRLLDETAILACAAYVDLNPIRAAIAQTLEKSDHTSIQLRIEALHFKPTTTNKNQINTNTNANNILNSCLTNADGFLSPVEIKERTDSLGPRPSRKGKRASEKGFLSMSTASYIDLLDWTARQVSRGKVGSTPKSVLPVFDRLRINGKVWCELVKDFGRLFSIVAGKPHVIDIRRSRDGRRSYRTKPRTRELLSCSPP